MDAKNAYKIALRNSCKNTAEIFSDIERIAKEGLFEVTFKRTSVPPSLKKILIKKGYVLSYTFNNIVISWYGE